MSTVVTPSLSPRELLETLPPEYRVKLFEEMLREKLATTSGTEPRKPWVPTPITAPPHVTPESKARMKRAMETLDNAFDPRERYKNELIEEDRD